MSQDSLETALILTLIMSKWNTPNERDVRARSIDELISVDPTVYEYLRLIIDQVKKLVRQGSTDKGVEIQISDEDLDRINFAINDLLYGLKLALSADGTWCILPNETEEGDHIFVLAGASMPVVLLPIKSEITANPAWHVVGAAYVHGHMDGERISRAKSLESDGVDISIFHDVFLE